MYTLVENYFKTVNELKEDKLKNEKYRSQIIPKVIISSLMDKLSKDPEVLPDKNLIMPLRTRLTFRLTAMIVLQTLKQRKILLHKEKQIIKQSVKFQSSIQEYERKSLDLAPKVENRSVKIENQNVK